MQQSVYCKKIRMKLSIFLFLYCICCTIGGPVFKDCYDIQWRNNGRDRCSCSGIYEIQPTRDATPFKVYCDMSTDGGGWTVIQRRMDGSVDFYRDWMSYQYGFGNLNGEFWLGLDKISRLTEAQSCLRVDLEDFEKNVRYANYSVFSVGGPRTNYWLTIGGYSGNAGDSLSAHNGRPFSTKDRDHDGWNRNCAEAYKGAWWYNACHASNLNGWYQYGPTASYATSVVWAHFKGHHYSLMFSEMKVKRCSV
ncbi:PREDICTED: ficolin-1-like [Amphimedon queenslandica]|uniref:Fibrinogen C-terminal domain-containing protein n=1 Tax=Amphimedon queenslandica TaxID=400682 RepID=A0A1X7VEH6_AMPQE|nr:PREDICTED: ficolin-1-like [Amphimedon queenslandica]|eukprot:XP_003384787.2 PREDICTED: ficolin-1-like [Amphimedon queenslandica]